MKTTIILPLECDPIVTFRWLWFAQQQELTAPIILVDNGSNGIVDKLIKGAPLFPGLNIKYILREGACFVDLCRAAVDCVKTDYVLISDVRALVYSYGVRRGGEFLDAQRSYSAVCGYIATYDQNPAEDSDFDVVGGTLQLWRSVFSPWNVQDRSGSMRIQTRMKYEVPPYFFTHKRADLRNALEQAVELGIDGREMFGIFLSGYQALLGNVKFDFSYISASFPRVIFNEWFDDFRASHNVMDPNWVGQLDRAAKWLAVQVEIHDWGVLRTYLNRLHRFYRAVWFEGFVMPTPGAEIRVRTGISHYLHNLLGAKFCPVILNGTSAAMLEVLDEGADDGIAVGRVDLSMVERTLSEDKFNEFIRFNVPVMLPSRGRK